MLEEGRPFVLALLVGLLIPVFATGTPVASDGSKTSAKAATPLASAGCSHFKKLPLSTFTKSTVVEDDCLEIISKQVITVQQDVRLVIIAHKQLRIGADSMIEAKGTQGGAGRPASAMSVDWVPSGDDQDEKIHCACRDTNCRDGWGHCSANGHAELRGGKGGTGQRGADVVIVAREIVLSTVRIEVGGGPGGPPGGSGHVDCKWNGIQCSSSPASNEGSGDTGVAGTASFAAGTKTADAVLKLPRFRGHPKTGVSDAEETRTTRAILA